MADKQLTEEDVKLALEGFKNLKGVAELVGMSNETLEHLYAFGYALYNSGNFKDAVTVFAPLCLFNQKDYRFWMGLGGALQGLGEYAKARDAYQYASIASNLNDVEPLYYAAKCLIAEGRPADAANVIFVIRARADKNDAKQLDFKNKAEALYELLKKNA